MADTRPVEVAFPASVSAPGLLDRVDHEDAFRVATSVERTPEQWMRAIVEGAPRWFRPPWRHVLGWVLRARIGPMHAPDHVLGWRVLVERPDVCVIGLDGAGGSCIRMITLTPPGHAVLATQIRAGLPLPGIRLGHRFFAPFLLERAAARAATAKPK